MSCADVQTIQAGDGTKSEFSFDFPYLFKSEIKVYFWNRVTKEYDEIAQDGTGWGQAPADTIYPWEISDANPTIVHFTEIDSGGNTAAVPPAPAAAVDPNEETVDNVKIRRETNIDDIRALFNPGSAIRSDDLNKNFEQLRYAIQEGTCQGISQEIYDYLQDNYWDRYDNTLYAADAWVSDDTKIATTAALDARFQDEVAETITSSEVWPDNDDTIATTAAIDNRIDTAITNDIGTDGTGITVTDDGDGTITLGLADNTIDFDKIKDSDQIQLADQVSNYEVAGSDNTVFTSSAAIRRFENYVQNAAPTTTAGIGKGAVWVDPDDDLTLSVWNGSAWLGITSGGTFTNQPKVVYVDASSGDDANDGHRISRPKASIKAAINQINSDATHGDGSVVIVAAGVYQEAAPIQIQKNNVSIIGQALRSCIVHPTPATETATLFELNSGSYVANLTLTGMKASGTRGAAGSLWEDATHGLPPTQGWNFAFLSGATITKSPYIQNCTNFSDSEIDNSNLNTITPAGGLAGDTDSAVTGGGLLVDGSTVDSNSPLRSMVCDSYTHVGLDGPGIFVTNNGYCQATSSYAFFNHFHIACINGGQANLAASTTDFGRFSLIADGQSPTNIFTSNVDGAAADGDITFNINEPVADASWHGSATRPQSNMLVTVNGVTYPVLSATAHTDSEGGSGWTVTISRPEAANKSNNLGLNGAVADDATVQFFLRSMIASSGHTMEYVGSGTNYSALPENGGVPDDTAQVVELNDGKIWTATTDHNGKFTVGPLEIDQRTGAITIESGATVTNVVDDPSPQLGGDLDANTFDIILTGGSETEPSLTFTGDADTGAFSPTADTVAITTGGAERLRVDSNGTVTIGTDSPRGVLPYGTTNFQSSAPITVETADADGAQLLLCANESTDGADNTAGLILARTRGSAIGDNTIVSDNDIVGTISFAAADGVDILNRTATIHSEVDGTPGADDTPGNLIFSTTSDADNQPDERMRIDSSGRVGVGTTSPGFELDVQGETDPSIRVRSTGTGLSDDSLLRLQIGGINAQTSILFGDNDNNSVGAIRYSHNSDSLSFTTNGSTAATIDENGRVGIGTTTPGRELEVFRDAGQAAIAITASTTGQSSLFFADTADSNIGAIIYSHSDEALTFRVNDGERARIDSSGNFGIGTTSVSAGLHIVRDVNPVLMLDRGSENTANANWYYNGTLTGQVSAANADFQLSAAGASTPISFYVNGSERAKIDTSGRLLVGTSSDISGGTTSGAIQAATAGGAYVNLGRNDPSVVSGNGIGGLRFYANDPSGYNIVGIMQCLADGTHASNNYPTRLEFATTASGASSPTERMRIDNAGKLYSVPTYNNTTGSTTNYMRIGADGQMYRSTSSIAYKTDVEDMEDAYADAILNLRPVWYRSTCEGDNPNHSHWGFIAEEVEQIDPRLCSFKEYEASVDEEGKQVVTPLDTPVVDGVDYASLTPLLLNLVKRQKAQIEALETRIAALEAN